MGRTFVPYTKTGKNDNETYFRESETNNVRPALFESSIFIFRLPFARTWHMIFLQLIFDKFPGRIGRKFSR